MNTIEEGASHLSLTNDINDSIISFAKESGNPVFYGLITMPNGDQFNVTATINQASLDSVGPFPQQANSKSLYVLAAAHKARGEAMNTLVKNIFEPAIRNLIEITLNR